jgi:hypothetical protein
MTAVLDADTDQVGEEIETLRQQVLNLQQQLRRARRGYVSKAQVQKVIDVGRQRRVWCGEAQQIAERFGVIGPDKIKVKVDLGVFGTATIDINADEFDRLDTDEARKTWLAGQIKISVNVGGKPSEGALTPTVVSYEEIIEAPPAPAEAPEGFPFALIPGYRFGYVSNMGRAAHVVDGGLYDQRGYALCSTRPSTHNGWVETSPQAERMTNWEAVADEDGSRPSVYGICTECSAQTLNRALRA